MNERDFQFRNACASSVPSPLRGRDREGVAEGAVVDFLDLSTFISSRSFGFILTRAP